MVLEFELDYDEHDGGTVVYKVSRKGMQVGTLVLDNIPYGSEKVIKNKMSLHNQNLYQRAELVKDDRTQKNI